MNNGLEAELRKREQVSDMMLTAHSILRDRFTRRSTAFDITLLVLSSILCGTTFLDPSLVKHFNLDPEIIRTILGLCAVLVFILSIIGLRVDWKERSSRYQYACRVLADIKAKSKELNVFQDDSQQKEAYDFLHASGLILRELAPIPDREFLKLKAQHKRKIEISKLLDVYPSAPVWMLRSKLFFRDLRFITYESKKNSGKDNAIK